VRRERARRSADNPDAAVTFKLQEGGAGNSGQQSGHEDTKSVAARNSLIVVGADGIEPPTFAL
jgi:hypothetical protein